jgi:putative alpha-1,2-mannosidase
MENNKGSFDRYDTFPVWDTTVASDSDMINSLLAHYKETGLLPVWSLQGNETI